MTVRRGGIAAGGLRGCGSWSSALAPTTIPPAKKKKKISLEGAPGLSPAAVPQGTIWQYTWWV